MLFALACLAAPVGADTLVCDGATVPEPLPIRPNALVPVSAELVGVGSQVGVANGALASVGDEALAVDRVLLRMRLEDCRRNTVAALTPPAQVDSGAATGYRKKTEFDNTPYRFNAEKGFTAAEFDAWMAARGIRIATGKPTTAQPAAVPVEAERGGGISTACTASAAEGQVAASC